MNETKSQLSCELIFVKLYEKVHRWKVTIRTDITYLLTFLHLSIFQQQYFACDIFTKTKNHNKTVCNLNEADNE